MFPSDSNKSAFTPDTIKKAIEDSLNTDISIPAGHKGALITMITDSGAQLAVATRINDNWSVELTGTHEWTGDNQVGFISKVTW